MVPLHTCNRGIRLHIALQVDIGALEQIIRIERSAQVKVDNGCICITVAFNFGLQLPHWGTLTRHIEHPGILQIESGVSIAQSSHHSGVALMQLLGGNPRIQRNGTDHLAFIILGYGNQHQFRYGCVPIGRRLWDLEDI